MTFETWLRSDLTKPLKVQALHGVFFSADNAANLIGAEVYNNGAPASLSGTCIGYAIRADGGTLPITGTVSGNKASIILPTSAYVIEGPLDVVIKVVSGSVKTTVGACRGYVQRATTDTIIDPGHVIPSLEELLALIEPMEEATDAANAAAASANSAASNANSKATAANTAAQSANTAASTANTAAGNATTAAEAANAAAAAAPTQANTEIKYQVSVSGEAIPAGQWLDTIPSVPQGSWLWVRTIISWDNGEVSDPIYTKARSGIDGSGSVVSVNGINPDANGNVTLPIDAAPTQGSQNPVTSGGTYAALAEKQDTLTFDSAPTSGSTNPVTSGGVYAKIGQVGDTSLQEQLTTVNQKTNIYGVPGGHINAQYVAQSGDTIDTIVASVIPETGTAVTFGIYVINAIAGISGDTRYIVSGWLNETRSYGYVQITNFNQIWYGTRGNSTTFFIRPLLTELGSVESGISIVAIGNTHPAILFGQYVFVRNHDVLSTGLYTATANIANGGTLSTSNLQAVTNGGLNALKTTIDTLNSSLAKTEIGLTKANANITNVEFANVIKYGKVCIVRLNFMIGTAITDSIAVLFTGLPPAYQNTRATIMDVSAHNVQNYVRLSVLTNGTIANAYTPDGISPGHYEGEIVYITN